MINLRQQTILFHQTPDYSVDNFFVHHHNQQAYDWVMAWPNWPSHAAMMTGDPGTGKTHLSHIFLRRSGADIIYFDTPLTHIQPHKAYLAEDIETWPDHVALFHFFNFIRESKGWLLMTSAVEPGFMDMALKDLRSRLQSVPVIRIGAFDDQAIEVMITKQFADRDIKISSSVITYMMRQGPRHPDDIRRLITIVCDTALHHQTSITIPLVRTCLRAWRGDELSDD